MKLLISILICAFLLVSCTYEYDNLVENECKLTGNSEVRTEESFYYVYMGNTPIPIPYEYNETYYQYKCKDDQIYWSTTQYVIDYDNLNKQ